MLKPWLPAFDCVFTARNRDFSHSTLDGPLRACRGRSRRRSRGRSSGSIASSRSHSSASARSSSGIVVHAVDFEHLLRQVLLDEPLSSRWSASPVFSRKCGVTFGLSTPRTNSSSSRPRRGCVSTSTLLHEAREVVGARQHAAAEPVGRRRTGSRDRLLARLADRLAVRRTRR